MVALAQALATNKNTPPLGDIVILSLGTGVHESVITDQNLDWGSLKWASPLINLLMDGTMDVAKFECKHLMGENYYRLSPYLGEDIAMDDAQLIGRLIEIAQGVDISRVLQWLRG